MCASVNGIDLNKGMLQEPWACRAMSSMIVDVFERVKGVCKSLFVIDVIVCFSQHKEQRERERERHGNRNGTARRFANEADAAKNGS